MEGLEEGGLIGVQGSKLEYEYSHLHLSFKVDLLSKSANADNCAGIRTGVFQVKI